MNQEWDRQLEEPAASRMAWPSLVDNLPLFFTAFVLIIAALGMLIASITPLFAAESYVIVGQRVAIGEDGELQKWGPSDSLVDTEVEILRSPFMAARVTAALKRDNDVLPPRPPEMKISRVGLTYLVKIRAEAPSAQAAEKYANAYASEYVAERSRQGAAAKRSALSDRRSDAADEARPTAELLTLAVPPFAPVHPPRSLLIILAVLAALVGAALAVLIAHALRRDRD